MIGEDGTVTPGIGDQEDKDGEPPIALLEHHAPLDCLKIAEPNLCLDPDYLSTERGSAVERPQVAGDGRWHLGRPGSAGWQSLSKRREKPQVPRVVDWLPGKVRRPKTRGPQTPQPGKGSSPTRSPFRLAPLVRTRHGSYDRRPASFMLSPEAWRAMRIWLPASRRIASARAVPRSGLPMRVLTPKCGETRLAAKHSPRLYDAGRAPRR